MASWVLVLILALLGLILCGLAAIPAFPEPTAHRLGFVGAALIGIAVAVIAAPNLN